MAGRKGLLVGSERHSRGGNDASRVVSERGRVGKPMCVCACVVVVCIYVNFRRETSVLVPGVHSLAPAPTASPAPAHRPGSNALRGVFTLSHSHSLTA